MSDRLSGSRGDEPVTSVAEFGDRIKAALRDVWREHLPDVFDARLASLRSIRKKLLIALLALLKKRYAAICWLRRLDPCKHSIIPSSRY